MDGLAFESVGEESSLGLERPFEGIEVVKVFKALNNEKALARMVSL